MLFHLGIDVADELLGFHEARVSDSLSCMKHNAKLIFLDLKQLAHFFRSLYNFKNYLKDRVMLAQNGETKRNIDRAVEQMGSERVSTEDTEDLLSFWYFFGLLLLLKVEINH